MNNEEHLNAHVNLRRTFIYKVDVALTTRSWYIYSDTLIPLDIFIGMQNRAWYSAWRIKRIINMREYFHFTSPLPPLFRHRAGSSIRESICASRKIWGVEREFPIDDVPYCRTYFHISVSYTIQSLRCARIFTSFNRARNRKLYGIVALIKIRATNFIAFFSVK